jgi:hypothetical protein
VNENNKKQKKNIQRGLPKSKKKNPLKPKKRRSEDLKNEE